MVERYQFGPFNSEDGTMSLMHPSLSPTEKLVKESAYNALEAERDELARCLDGGVDCANERIAAKARIAQLEAALFEIAVATASENANQSWINTRCNVAVANKAPTTNSVSGSSTLETPLLHETLTYPCGCSASGTYPLPTYCGTHSSPETGTEP